MDLNHSTERFLFWCCKFGQKYTAWVVTGHLKEITTSA